MMSFPQLRLRRLRRTPALRRLVRETRLHPAMLVMPLFVQEGKGIREAIPSMPGQFRLSIDQLPGEIESCENSGIGAILLFGIPQGKDEKGSGAWLETGIVQNALRALRPITDLPLIADVCLCEYTSHGHCGVLNEGRIDNDETLKLLAEASCSLAAAGADIVAPSDMMDGRVAAIRQELDRKGWQDCAILSYAAKHASSFYGPFREAAGSAPGFGDRRSYQMDAANGREAAREIAEDLAEGADLLMIKPALPCLDLIRQCVDAHPVPVAAYQVSGEYLMIKAAAASGYMDEKSAVLESLTACARAGARLLVSYFAREAADWIKEYNG